ncbi:MAG: hypothetical protein LBJ44_07190 [Propionibacteriaceae bacterium]|jgi:hypothetical protein|nr:hypothetical protein [Propionibacteriaceae bacterium]
MKTTTQTIPPRVVGPLLAAALAAVLAGCGANAPAGDPSVSDSPSAAAATETQAAQPRIAYTYDGGIVVLDATSLETLADIPLDGFNRLNSAGDGRHLVVSTSGGFRLLDLGAYGVPHGGHSHYYIADPVLTDITFAAQTPGHVVSHDDQTALFDDGTGRVTLIEADEIGDPDAPRREYSAAAPHHGVAVLMGDGVLLVTEGTTDYRSTVQAVDQQDQVLAQSADCPGVHGEAVAAGEVVVFGCQGGVLLYQDGVFSRLEAPSATASVGTQVGGEDSAVVLGDYEDEDDGAAGPNRVSLTDTATAQFQVVDLPAGVSYSSRSLARDQEGAALVLGTDGALHVIDPLSRSLVASHPVLPAWSLPDEWQQTRPTIAMLDGMAYITDPAAQKLYVVYPKSGQIWKTVDLAHVPNEITGVSGDGGGEHDHDEEDHEDD